MSCVPAALGRDAPVWSSFDSCFVLSDHFEFVVCLFVYSACFLFSRDFIYVKLMYQISP